MAYYMTCNVNGCVSLELRSISLQRAVDEAYDRVAECSEGRTDLEEICGVSLDGVTYSDACEILESRGAKCVSRSGVVDGVDIWIR